MIQIDDTLYLVKTVVGFRQFRLQQSLSGCQYLQIGSRITELHQLLRIIDGGVQGSNLLSNDFQP